MKILIWSRWIDDIFLKKNPPDGTGGAELQMAFWSSMLAEKCHKVYTFSWRVEAGYKKIRKVKFLWIPWVRKFGIVFNPLRFLYFLLIRPHIVITKSANDLSILNKLDTIVKTRFILVLASDSNVEDPDYIQSYITCLRKRDLIVAQNEFQFTKLNQIAPELRKILLLNTYDKDILNNVTPSEKEYDFIWIGNLKKSKRPDLFIKLAFEKPDCTFCLIGGTPDYDYLHKIKNNITRTKNIHYYERLSVYEVNSFMQKAKVLIHTSEKEGFPNVFLQAWSFNRPVISTIDPNNVIINNNIGFFVSDFHELLKKSSELIANFEMYNTIQKNIENYFSKNHNQEITYHKIREYLQSEKTLN